MSINKNSISSKTKPIYCKSIKYINLPEFREMVTNKCDFFISELLTGYVYVVKNMIDKNFIVSTRNKVHEFGLLTDSSWNDTKNDIKGVIDSKILKEKNLELINNSSEIIFSFAKEVLKDFKGRLKKVSPNFIKNNLDLIE